MGGIRCGADTEENGTERGMICCHIAKRTSANDKNKNKFDYVVRLGDVGGINKKKL